MKNIDLMYLCSVIAGLSGIPVRIFEGETLVYYSFVGRLPRDPLEICKKEVFAIEKNLGYYMTGCSFSITALSGTEKQEL